MRRQGCVRRAPTTGLEPLSNPSSTCRLVLGTTTIRLTNRGKRALERLRAALERTSRRKVTQQEAAERAFAAAVQHPEILVEKTWPGLSKEARRKFEAMQGNFGRWSSDDIDAVIADQAHGMRPGT